MKTFKLFIALLLFGTATQAQILGRVTSTAPTYPNNSTMPVSITTGGAVRVDATFSGSLAVTVDSTTASRKQVKALQDGSWSVAQSGTWNITNISGTISLPTGAATETTLNTIRANATDASQKTMIVDGSGNIIAATSNRMQVDPSGVTSPVSLASVPSHAVTNAGTFAVQVSSTALPTGAATAALQTQPGVDIGDVTINNASGASAVNIQDGGNSITVDGTVAFSNSTIAVTNTGTFATQSAATQSGTWTVQPGNTANTTAWKVDGSAVTQPVSYATTGSGTATGALRVELPTNGTGVIATVGTITNPVTSSVTPVTSGGLTTYHLVSAATTNATVLKASAGQVYGWYIYNSNAATRKVAFHNTASTPTAGASIYYALVIPAGSGANVEFTNGLAFSTGIAITTVTELTDAGTTAVGASDLIINVWFK